MKIDDGERPTGSRERPMLKINNKEKKLKKKLSILIALVMAIALCLVPAVAQAAGPAPGYDSQVILENKTVMPSPPWPVIQDGIQGILDYNKEGATFEYSFTATGMETNTEYALIYYADKPDRFVSWGGDNPGALITLCSADATGHIAKAGETELDMNLPSIDDANISEYDYKASVEDGGTGDLYDNAHGAKIWLVPANCWEDGAENKVTVWAPTRFLFETELISYNDTDIDVVGLNAELEQIVAISVTPSFIHYGDIQPGAGAIAGLDINVENIGTVTVVVDAELAEFGSVFDYLRLAGKYPMAGKWLGIIASLQPSVTKACTTALDVPATYSAQGVEYVDLVFYAEIATP